jgi:hypothetical protein
VPIQLAIDPTLQVSPRRFAAEWNADPRAGELATAELRAGGLESYDPNLGEIVLLLTTQMALAVAGNALYDLIKDILLKQGVCRSIRIVQHQSAGGSQLLIAMAEDAPEDTPADG